MKFIQFQLFGITVLLISLVLNVQKVKADEYYTFTSTEPQDSYECLAEALYFEAAQDGDLGMYLVGKVIINRHYDTQYEFKDLNTICEVVHQPSRNPAKPWECAFSYHCDGKPEIVPDHPLEVAAMYAAEAMAYSLLNDRRSIDFTDGALYYTQPQIDRGWMLNTTITVTYLNHVFRKPKEIKFNNELEGLGYEH